MNIVKDQTKNVEGVKKVLPQEEVVLAFWIKL